MTPSSGMLVREARHRAGLSQSDLARRAGVAQSVISAYESGRREPAMTMLAKLVEAAGQQLQLSLAPVPGAPRGLPDTPMGRRLRRRRKAIVEASAAVGANNVRLCGSVARGEDSEMSDVDLLVDLDVGVGLVSLIGLERTLTDMLGRRVEVVPAESIKSAMSADVYADAVPL
jgi:predicted nucleotidyltransferase/DNA-binding XRE family transcriptional regulator